MSYSLTFLNGGHVGDYIGGVSQGVLREILGV